MRFPAISQLDALIGESPMENGLTIPETIIRNWQGIVDILAEITGIPAALIMRINDPDIEVLLASDSAGNPYEAGAAEHLWGSGLYCETVIKTNRTCCPECARKLYPGLNPTK
jgi:hypothetical protein